MVVVVVVLVVVWGVVVVVLVVLVVVVVMVVAVIGVIVVVAVAVVISVMMVKMRFIMLWMFCRGVYVTTATEPAIILRHSEKTQGYVFGKIPSHFIVFIQLLCLLI